MIEVSDQLQLSLWVRKDATCYLVIFTKMPGIFKMVILFTYIAFKCTTFYSFAKCDRLLHILTAYDLYKLFPFISNLTSSWLWFVPLHLKYLFNWTFKVVWYFFVKSFIIVRVFIAFFVIRILTIRAKHMELSNFVSNNTSGMSLNWSLQVFSS